jgi:hypothetical protein
MAIGYIIGAALYLLTGGVIRGFLVASYMRAFPLILGDTKNWDLEARLMIRYFVFVTWPIALAVNLGDFGFRHVLFSGWRWK